MTRQIPYVFAEGTAPIGSLLQTIAQVIVSRLEYDGCQHRLYRTISDGRRELETLPFSTMTRLHCIFFY